MILREIARNAPAGRTAPFRISTLRSHSRFTVPARMRQASSMTDAELRAAALQTIAREGITIDSIASLPVYGHGLLPYCPGCQRWVDVDIKRLVEKGYGKRKLRNFKPKCRRCGGRGQLQVRAPVPQWGGASWSAIPAIARTEVPRRVDSLAPNGRRGGVPWGQ